MTNILTSLSIEAIFNYFPREKRSHLKSSIPALRKFKPSEFFKKVEYDFQQDKILVFFDNSHVFFHLKTSPLKFEKLDPLDLIYKEYQTNLTAEKLIQNFEDCVLDRYNVTVEEVWATGSLQLMKRFASDATKAKLSKLVYQRDKNYIPGTFLEFSIQNPLEFMFITNPKTYKEDKMSKIPFLQIIGRKLNIEATLAYKCKKLDLYENNIELDDFLKIMHKFASGVHEEGSRYAVNKILPEIEKNRLNEIILNDFPGNSRLELKNEVEQVVIQISQHLELRTNFDNAPWFMEVVKK